MRALWSRDLPEIFALARGIGTAAEGAGPAVMNSGGMFLAHSLSREALQQQLGHAAPWTTTLNLVARWRRPTGQRRGVTRGPPR